IAFLLPAEKIPSMMPMNPWIETHAALSLVAFGAFGLGCISGMMFLVQERQLKSQHPDPIFHHLPPIRILEEATIRLLWMGLILLTISFAAGWIASHSISGLKFWISLLIWGAYSFILFFNQKHRLTGHRLALSVIVIFFFALLILPLIGYVSDLALR
ncbi:MAG: cytochrome c biogenesis protein CcsA, partial [Chthoniobacterales bacterium]|nr:cytochrome c biogenesis protein CcsA [Chthoniobacterales bacterium]